MTQRTRKTNNKQEKLSDQVEKKVTQKKKESNKEKVFHPSEGRFENMISTGSTLLDLAISGGKVKGGGIPGGITIEVFGPPSIGKTSILCEIAGAIKRQGGETRFHDPEARLSTIFAQIFDFDLKEDEISHPNTPKDVFDDLQKWKAKNTKIVNGIFVDSMAALASDMEMEGKKDEYSRRAKLFSQGLRINARLISNSNYLFVCSNQIRDNIDAGFGEKYTTTGGWAFKFYGSLRLKATKQIPQRNPKITREVTYKGKKYVKTVGIGIDVKVDKSSIWEPYNTAPVYIIWDYGLDDVRANLEYVKKITGDTIYKISNTKLANSMEESIKIVEKDELEDQLKNQVINLWEELQEKFKKQRKKKRR